MSARKLQRGERPPPGLKDFVISLGARDPKPTNTEISEAAGRKYGVEPSVRTIRRYCAVAGVPTGKPPRRRGMGEGDRQQVLRIGQPYTMVWGYVEGVRRNVVRLPVNNMGTRASGSFYGVLEVMAPESRLGLGEHQLHWADTEYTLKGQTAESVTILPGLTRTLDVAFTVPPAEQVHGPGTSPVPIDPGTATATGLPRHGGEGQPMGASFQEGAIVQADRRARDKTGGKGCWVAIPLALSRSDMAGQAYFPPGEYTVRVRVVSESGQEDVKTLKLTSPETWDGLSLEEVKP